MESFFELVQEQLLQVEEHIQAQAEGYHPELHAALEHLLASGGKRIRPTLVLLAGQMLEVQAGPLITLAAAVELLHTATLVHDDLIDGSLLRRGNPTLNARWSPAATVLTGDFLFARAAKLASELNSPPALRVFSNALATIVDGEVRQMFISRGQANRQDYEQRIYAKTASLFEASMVTIGILSEAGESIRTALKQFGYELGMAFQIVDDILDFTGEQSTVGKPVASDLRQGLVTLPALYYLEANPHNTEMRAILNQETYDEADFASLLDQIRSSDAIAQAAEEALQYKARAVLAAGSLPDSKERVALLEMADYIVNRRL
ncbi:MAG: polyprenyl synthetase family protein [Chloroflexota bacterium]